MDLITEVGLHAVKWFSRFNVHRYIDATVVISAVAVVLVSALISPDPVLEKHNNSMFLSSKLFSDTQLVLTVICLPLLFTCLSEFFIFKRAMFTDSYYRLTLVLSTIIPSTILYLMTIFKSSVVAQLILPVGYIQYSVTLYTVYRFAFALFADSTPLYYALIVLFTFNLGAVLNIVNVKSASRGVGYYESWLFCSIMASFFCCWIASLLWIRKIWSLIFNRKSVDDDSFFLILYICYVITFAVAGTALVIEMNDSILLVFNVATMLHVIFLFPIVLLRVAYFMKTNMEMQKQKRNLVRYVSQQIKTPVDIIKGGLFTLEDDVKSFYQDDQNVEPMMNLIGKVQLSMIQAMNAMSGLVDLECMKDEHIRIDKKRFSPQKILSDNLIASFRIYARSKDIQMTTEMIEHSDMYYLNGDELKLQVVLRNIFSNALHFTPSGGMISICQQVEQCPLGPMFKIDITDTGIGIDPSMQVNLFEQPTEYKSSKVYMDGSGLGLYISRKIIRLHGGEITYKSDGLSKGTTFTICLPVCKPPVSRHDVDEDSISLQMSDVSLSSYYGDDDGNISVSKVGFFALGSLCSASENAANQSKSDVRILIVDSAVACSVLCDKIETYFDFGRVGLSLNIVSATDELSALHAVNDCILKQETSFDFVIVSYNFDFTSGLAVVKKMKEIPGFTACVVGLLADSSSPDHATDFLSYGANMVLTKPIDSDTLGKLLVDNMLASIFFS